MKTIQKIFALIICLLALTTAGFAQNTTAKSDTTAKIKTSAICEMCKATIEKAMKKVKGVSSSNLDVDTKDLTVTFDKSKVNLSDIRTALNRAGYDADSTQADKRAYNKLSPCCKKPEGK